MLSNIQTTNQVPIDVEFGKLKDVMDWCRSNCSGDWHINEVNPGIYAYERPYNLTYNHYVFEFKNESDLITFNLRFK